MHSVDHLIECSLTRVVLEPSSSQLDGGRTLEQLFDRDKKPVTTRTKGYGNALSVINRISITVLDKAEDGIWCRLRAWE